MCVGGSQTPWQKMPTKQKQKPVVPPTPIETVAATGIYANRTSTISPLVQKLFGITKHNAGDVAAGYMGLNFGAADLRIDPTQYPRLPVQPGGSV